MQSYLKTKPFWIQLLLFLGMAFGIFVVLSLIGISILSKITNINLVAVSDPKSWNMNDPGMLTFVRGMLVIQFFGLFLIPTVLFAYFSDPRPFKYLGFQKPVKHIYWIIAIAVMLVAIPLVEYTGMLNRQFNFGEGMQKWLQSMEDEAAIQIQFMLSRNTVTELIMNIIFIALLAGIGEELFFRGVLQRLFIKAFKSPWPGIILAAVIFSAIHLQFFGFIPRLLLGILLGAIYWYSGSLWPAIIAHFVYDAFFIVLAYFQPNLVKNPEATVINQSMLGFLALASVLLIVLLLWLMRRFSTVRYENIYDNDLPTQQKNNITF
jgi:membrane protease YdiL (CAAX protease family)